MGEHPRFETLTYDLRDDHVVEVVLDRPLVLNSFNQQMLDEFERVWAMVKSDPDVHAVVLAANGDRAFSTGVDRIELYDVPGNVWNWRDPGEFISPKQNGCWKPCVCALHGMVAGGAFYWVNDADIVICSDDAVFFDPHVSYGMTAVLEPVGLAARVRSGDVLRMSLLGLDERMSAARAFEIGLVSEVVPRARLRARAREIAASAASKPPVETQASVRAIWESRQMAPAVAEMVAAHYERLLAGARQGR